MIKRTIKVLILVIVGLFLVNKTNVKASWVPVEVIDGASIRAKSGEDVKQGLRFYARLIIAVEEQGFYIVYGESTVQNLKNAIGGEFIQGVTEVNGKVVYKVQVPNHAPDWTYSVVLINIPEEGYFDEISAFPYAVYNGVEYVVEPTKRSVTEVALKVASAGSDSSADVITYLENNYKILGFNIFGDLELTNNMIEKNHILLRDVFLEDWNTYNNSGWSILSGSILHGNGAVGASTHNLSGTRIYKFFHDSRYKDKWRWLLEVIKIKSSGLANLQAQAYLGDGTVDEVIYLEKGMHLHYSIANFFNGKHETVETHSTADFSSPLDYANILYLIDGIYVDSNKYDFYQEGDTLEFLEAQSRDGYTFSHFKLGEEIYLAESTYEVTQDNVIFEPIYDPITYNIDFYYDGNELLDLKETYTILDTVTLEPYVKEDFIFRGWYDNPELNGSPITKIYYGTFGNITLYAKGIDSIYAEVEVTYNLNGGSIANHEDLVEYRESVLVVATRYSNSEDSYGRNIAVSETPFNSFWNVMGFKETEFENVYEFLGRGMGYSNPEATLYVNYHNNNIISAYKEAIIGVYDSIKAGDILVIPLLPEELPTAPTTIDLFFMADDVLTIDVVMYLINPRLMPITPVKEGFIFAGWYKDEEFLDGPVIEYPGYLHVEEIDEITYYAKWDEE